MKAMKLFSVGLIASAMSVSAFAMNPDSEFTVETNLPDIIRVDVVNDIVPLALYNDRLEGNVGVSVKMRGASDENIRPYVVKIDQKDVSGGYEMVHEDKKDTMPLDIHFHPGLHNTSGHRLTNGTESTPFETNNGLDSELRNNTYLSLFVNKGNHENAFPGAYTSNLTLWVNAK